MSDVAPDNATTVARILELTDGIRRSVVAAQDAAAAAVRAPWVTRDVADAVVGALGDYAGSVRWVLDRVTVVLDGAAFVDDLTDAGEGWRPVGSTLTGVGAQWRDLRPGVVDSWEGRGGAGYADSVEPQASAADRTAQIAGRAAEVTTTLAGAGRTFYLALAVSLSEFAARTAGLPRALTAVPAAPAALASAATAAATLLGYVRRYEEALDRQVSAAAGTAATLISSASDASAYGAGGRWPDPAIRPGGST